MRRNASGLAPFFFTLLQAAPYCISGSTPRAVKKPNEQDARKEDRMGQIRAHDRNLFLSYRSFLRSVS